MDDDWLDGNWASDYGTPEFLTSDDPRAGTATEQPASQAAEHVDQPSGEYALPLLRLSGWERDKQYDKNNPVCMHYSYHWKLSQRENIRRRTLCFGTYPDLVLAPTDFWKDTFEARLKSLREDNDKFPGDHYTCEETIIEISIERTRQRGFKTPFKNLQIDWQMVDEHLEGLSGLFIKGRMITVSIEFVYKEVTGDSTTAKGKGKRKSATEVQKLQRAAAAGLWTRVYEYRRCRARHCKGGPHCMTDEQGNHRTLLPAHLEEIVDHIKKNMKDGETEETVDVTIEIPPHIRQRVLDNSRKRKADSSTDCRRCKDPGDVKGDRQDRLEEYCNWGLTQVKSGRWRYALQDANRVAMDKFVELNTALQYPNKVVDLMMKEEVSEGAALQFVSNIKHFLRQEEES
jgi:hypothetical protein